MREIGSTLAAPWTSAGRAVDEDLDKELETLNRQNRLRVTHAYDGQGRSQLVDGNQRELISFCSNDYLGLAGHPALAAALAKTASQHGVGSGASRLVSGESPIHLALEARLAAFVGAPAALLYPTGYLANLGVLTALARPEDLIVSDAANHASIIDGCRLSRAHVTVYAHLDADAARSALAAPGPYRRRLLVTESVFSMDGDRAPLPALAESARSTGAILMVDEAHALGVSGPQGRGVCAAVGVKPDVLIGTLGKAFGTHGGFAAGSPSLRHYLINRARPFIYSTASPPPLAAATLTAVDLIAGHEGETLRAKAHSVAAYLRTTLAAAGVQIPGEDLILPYVLGEDVAALELAGRLRRQGFLVPAIRPPTVAPGTARLRITATAAHTDGDAHALAAALNAARVDRGL